MMSYPLHRLGCTDDVLVCICPFLYILGCEKCIQAHIEYVPNAIGSYWYVPAGAASISNRLCATLTKVKVHCVKLSGPIIRFALKKD